MKRFALWVVAAAALLAPILAPGSAGAKGMLLYSGAYTDKESKGIYVWRFDQANGSLEPLGLAAETLQPAHLWASPNNKYLYAVNWQAPGWVSAFRVSPKDGKLTLLNKVSAKGDLPNQVVLDPTGRVAVTVNYNTGNLVAYRVQSDGKLSEAFYVDQHAGKPLSERQPGPKAHGAEFSKDGKFLYVAELGLDRIYSYAVDPVKGVITPGGFINTHAGAGPRRMQVSADGHYLYVNHETDSEVSVFRVDGLKVNEVQVVSTLPPDYKERNSTAEIALAPSGRFLYVSNRGHDSIVTYSVDPKTGKLTTIGHSPAGGRTPRNIRLDASGKYLAVANENGGNITIFSVNQKTGALSQVDQAPISTPGGVYFVSTP
jgi:6-phosphogluconolactonase